MKNSLKRLLQALISLTLAISLFAVLPQSVESVGDVGDIEVSISPIMSVADIEAAIQGAINNSAGYDTINVTGRKTDADDNLMINIPAGVTVKWGAEYAGAAPSNPDGFIDLSGNGVFDVVSGGSLTMDGDGGRVIKANKGISVVVSGGLVEVLSEAGYAIDAVDSVSVSGGTVKSIFSSSIVTSGIDSIVAISGGLVQSASVAIQANGFVYVSGGKVITTSYYSNGCAIGVGTPGSAVTVSGTAEVEAAGNGGVAIYAMNNTAVIVFGGTIKAGGVNGVAIKALSGGILIDGGVVKATGVGGIAIDSYESPVSIHKGAVTAEGAGGIAVRTGGGLLLNQSLSSSAGSFFGLEAPELQQTSSPAYVKNDLDASLLAGSGEVGGNDGGSGEVGGNDGGSGEVGGSDSGSGGGGIPVHVGGGSGGSGGGMPVYIGEVEVNGGVVSS
ncbi:MAG: hypothetical protein FWH55_05710, partial [Oscillospiraceae bacterium]|nr:hypothetical protein [Oscillospiraceae bacterium]